MVEMIDFSKDVYYNQAVQHQSAVICFLLWLFALFAVTYKAFGILLMTRWQYDKNFGRKDTEQLRETGCKYYLKFLGIKMIRFIKEAFHLQSPKEMEQSEVKNRVVRNQFFVAVFENLPQFALQLYEMFQIGATFGFIQTFSVVFSLIMFQYSSGSLMPQILR